MDIIFYLITAYLTIINIVAICITAYDKHAARKDKWRVRESTLMLISALGGSIGMYITMQLVRHKTRHLKFMLGIPVILIIQVILVIFIWRMING